MGVQQEIREKGLLGAVAGIGDDVFTRVTAGISVGEFRRMLQGEAPGRPNPRLKPHSEAFLLHIKPTYYHESATRFNHTFRLGLLSTYLFLIETITGLLLMIWYAPAPERAYADMIGLLTNVPFGQFLRDLHRLGAEAMVAIVTLHMVRVYLTGSYKPPRQFTWFTGVVLLVVTLFLSFSGYLLPWDQLSLWAVTIGTSMAEAVPPAIVGETVNLLARGAPDIGANGLLRFYLLHVIFLPLVLILFFFVHYYKVVHFGISLPADEEEIGEDTASRIPAAKRVYYLPDVAIDELSFLTVFTMITILLTVFFFQAPLEHIANPQSTPLHTVAPWYFYWLQGMLKIADKFIAGVAVPGILLVLLVAIPYLDKNPSRRGRDRRVAIVSGIIAGMVMLILGWMGTPKYAVQGAPSIEIVQELMPEEGSGLVREIGYAHLPLGVYSTDDHTKYDDPQFAELMHEYTAAVLHFDEQENDFNGARGQLTITQDQPGLKKINWKISWYDAQSQKEVFQKAFWLHRDSFYWEQYGLKHKYLDYLSNLISPKE